MSAAPNARPNSEEVSSSLAGDFRNSFRFAQGDPALQLALINALGMVYQRTISPRTVLSAIMTGEAHRRMTETVLPGSHVDIGQGKLPEAYRATDDVVVERFAENFDRMLSFVAGGDHEISSPSTLHEIGNLTIARDIRFQDPDRPRGPQSSDPHASYFRQHVLLGETTRSEAFDDIFAEINTLYKPGVPDQFEPERLDELQRQWETNHPGIAFL